MAFLLDTLKNLGSEEEEGGFTDLNYQIGNTSGMDIGQVPGPLDQRIGRMAQIGGSIMEIQITNPATFQIDRPELMNVIDQLGFEDVTLHGDPNIGFTGAYATRGQGVTGYNIVHRYFKRYLEQMASFKEEASQEDKFDVGYVNMHASNEQIPPREERLASDVSVDPFGQRITNINGDKSPNIYKNRDFLERLFDYFFLEMVEQPWQQYERTFSDVDEDFRKTWNQAKAREADKYFYGEKGDVGFKDKISLFQTAASIDQGVEEAFLEKLSEYELKEDGPIEMNIRIDTEQIGGLPDTELDFTIPIETLEEVSNNFTSDGGRRLFSSPARMSRDFYELTERIANPRPQTGKLPNELQELVENTNVRLRELLEIASIGYRPKEDSLRDALRRMIEDIWEKGAQSYESSNSFLSSRSKLQALARNIDIQNSTIYEQAEDFKESGIEVEEAAKEAFSDPDNDKILKNLTQGRIRDDFNKESSIFFHIMPAWMQTADFDGHENHGGWSVPKFIWENILNESIEESDVTDDPYFEDWDEFQDFLEENRRNQLNVIAAVGSCYMWGHFTQNRDDFEAKAFQQTVRKTDAYEEPEFEGDSIRMNWVKWMKRFGLHVNIEAMFGSPGELRRVWRPKDIAITCHAINKEAKNQLGDDWENNLVKFTIDMEHTASYGVDPLQELKTLIEEERRMAKVGEIDADPDKPLSEIVKTYHLTKPGWEQQSGHRHGPFARGDKTLYTWLYELVKNGFARNGEDEARIIFEVGGEYREEMYVIRVAMDMIELGLEPKELDPNRVDPGGDYGSREEALIARFFGMDRGNYDREWAKIEEHAFDPLDGLLESRGFDETFSGQGAIEQGQARPNEWKNEEYQ